MYKTYYVNSYIEYCIPALITKAETRKEALIKLNHFLSRNHYNIKLKEYDLQELDKTEIIRFIC